MSVFVPRSRSPRAHVEVARGWSSADPARRVREALARWPQLRFVLGLVVFEAAFYVAYRFGMSFPQDRPAPFWFPDTILLCALLLTPPSRWWVFVLAVLPVRLFTSVPPDLPRWFLLTAFVIDSAKGVLAAAALRRFVGTPIRLGSTWDFVRYLLVAVAIVPALAALGGATVRTALGFPFGPTWLGWFTGNAMTHLVVTPAVLYACLDFPWRTPAIDPRRTVEAGILAVTVIFVGFLGFRTGPADAGLAETCRFLLVPLLFWAALRFGMRGASVAILALVWFTVQATLEGTGPFAREAPAQAAAALQQFLFLAAAPLYFVASASGKEESARRFVREGEGRFRDVARAAPIMIWMSDPDGRRTYFNAQWLAFTGRTHEAEEGDGWLEAVHPDDRGRVRAGGTVVTDSRKRFVLEYRLRCHDGRHLWMRDQGMPCRTADGEFLGYIGSCVDLADRNRAEAEARLLSGDVAHVGRVSALGQLAFSLAHELNQPLGAILRNAEAAELILRQDPPDHEELLAILADIRQDDQRAGAVIDHMRSLLKRRDLKLEPLSVMPLVEQVLVLLRSEMMTRRVSIVRNMPAALPPVWGDPVHLEQVLINLLVNAADAVSGADIEQRRIEIRARLLDAQTVGVSVHDTGPGIPEERIGRLFEPFYTTKSSGLGMGLSIAKVIIESHSGRIWAENGPQGGAVVSFTLRVAAPGTS